MIYFLLLTLDLICSSFSGFLRWKLRLSILDLPCFLIYTFNATEFLSKHCFHFNLHILLSFYQHFLKLIWFFPLPFQIYWWIHQRYLYHYKITFFIPSNSLCSEIYFNWYWHSHSSFLLTSVKTGISFSILLLLNVLCLCS